MNTTIVVCAWVPPTGWTQGEPSVYFSFNTSRDFTLKTGAGTVVTDKDSVLVPGVVRIVTQIYS